MADPDDLDRSDIVRRLFTQMTARFEDGAEIAVAGQNRAATPVEQASRADTLHAIADEIVLLADVVRLIVGGADRL